VRAGDGEKRINGGNLRVARRALAMHACGPWRRERDAEVVDGARKAVVEANARLPAEHALGERDVGPALARIVARGRREDDRRARADQAAHALGQLEHRELRRVANVQGPGQGSGASISLTSPSMVSLT
jgi:hypothetical protein